jgi:hypothetical protein
LKRHRPRGRQVDFLSFRIEAWGAQPIHPCEQIFDEAGHLEIARRAGFLIVGDEQRRHRDGGDLFAGRHECLASKKHDPHCDAGPLYNYSGSARRPRRHSGGGFLPGSASNPTRPCCSTRSRRDVARRIQTETAMPRTHRMRSGIPTDDRRVSGFLRIRLPRREKEATGAA